jgi:RNA polymerase sigma-70 factor, ECF subfamily
VGLPELANRDLPALTAWRRLDEVPDPALPWLLGVARRVVANQRRGEQRRERLRLAAG